MKNCYVILVLTSFSLLVSCKLGTKQNSKDINALYSIPNYEGSNGAGLSKMSSFSFKISSDDVIETDEFKQELRQITRVLMKRKDKKLVITGQFSTEENKASGDFLNLGFARAETVKKHLLELGVSEQQIILQSKEYDNLPSSGSYVLEGVRLNLETANHESTINHKDAYLTTIER